MFWRKYFVFESCSYFVLNILALNALITLLLNILFALRLDILLILPLNIYTCKGFFQGILLSFAIKVVCVNYRNLPLRFTCNLRVNFAFEYFSYLDFERFICFGVE